MHYINGREAKAGDMVIHLQGSGTEVGILHSVNAGATSCNGRLAKTGNDSYVTIGECIHVDDVVSTFKNPITS